MHIRARKLFDGPSASVIGAIFSLLLGATAWSQETTGGLRGIVTDATGAVIPNAQTAISGPALMRAQQAYTDSTGSFEFQTLPPGIYTLDLTAAGFVPVKRVQIDLQVGKILRMDIRMEVGGARQAVEVSAEGLMVDTSQSTVAANVGSSTFDRLAKGRNFDSLIALAPGARYEPKAGGYQVDGASASENVFVIDGMDLTNLFSGGLPRSGQIPFDFVEELQIKSSGFEAQYGGAMGGVINVVTKRGGDSLHGNFGLDFASDAMQAGPRPTQRLNPENDNLLENFANPRDGYRMLNPGGSLGGPIMKNKLWFFAGWYPEFVQIDRKVTFNVDKSTGTYFEHDRTDYLNGKLDASPAAKLRLYAGYIYSSSRQNGVLPAAGGTDSPNNPWADKGGRSPAASYTFGGDYLATPKLIFSTRGGYNYTNYKDYGVPRQTGIYYASSNKTIADVPAAWQAPAGWVQQANEFFQKNIQDRFRSNSDVSYSAAFAGHHTIKAGWEINQLHNSPNRNTYPDGYLRYYWNGTYTGINGTKMKGQYGYLRYRTAQITGDASSSNQSLFLQDNWQLGKRLTVILGLRTEREFVPSFAVANNIPSRAIEFGFGQKLAPRLGFAWDPKGDSRWKVAGSFGLFYDLMKYALPQGSFGGAKWKDYYYALDKADPSYYLPLLPRDPAGLAADAPLRNLTTFEVVDWRIPANNPNDNTIDPNLQPMRRRVFDIGMEHALSTSLVVNVRYTHNSMDRAIEDVGTLTPAGEKYYIANPGYGITVNPQTWGAAYPMTPEAKRNYDAVEIRADRRFSNHYYFSASYTWSRLWGNYSGLASTDDTAVPNPNASRYFDLPYASYDSHGNLAEGLLATDRPHTFKFYGAYALKSRFGETNFGPAFQVFSGTPLTTELFAISSVPVYVDGRGDLVRTPVLSQVDLYLYHEFRFPKREQFRVRIDANITNVLNHGTVTSRYTNYLNRNDGSYLQFQNPADYFKGFDWKSMVAQQTLRTDPGYNKDNAWQGPRNMRFGLKFFF